jgi:hypothetical protein
MFKRRTLVSLLAGAFAAGRHLGIRAVRRAHHQVHQRRQRRPPGGRGRQEDAGSAQCQDRRQDEDQRLLGRRAGGDLPATQALRAGTQEMVCTSSSPLVGIVKELGVFDLPFLFANEKRPTPCSTARRASTSTRSWKKQAWSTWPTGRTVFAT